MDNAYLQHGHWWWHNHPKQSIRTHDIIARSFDLLENYSINPFAAVVPYGITFQRFGLETTRYAPLHGFCWNIVFLVEKGCLFHIIYRVCGTCSNITRAIELKYFGGKWIYISINFQIFSYYFFLKKDFLSYAWRKLCLYTYKLRS